MRKVEIPSDDYDDLDEESKESDLASEDPDTSMEKKVTKKGGASKPKTASGAKEPKGPTKKEIKEQDKAAALAIRD